MRKNKAISLFIVEPKVELNSFIVNLRIENDASAGCESGKVIDSKYDIKGWIRGEGFFPL